MGKNFVRDGNHGCWSRVSIFVKENGRRFVPGEAVFLLREIRIGRLIHEIGTRGRVLADHGAVIVLHLDGSDAEIVTCLSEYVARASERSARAPVPRLATPRLRPSLG